MATLISAHNSEGCYGRCDAKCHDATSDKCDCICGGANHGVGLSKAIEQTKAYAEVWMEEYRARHPAEDLDFKVLVKPVQLELF